ncbi:hypothetical protein DPMN_166256 [Dreissena polymorpha]|uniref:Ig-like domain-containing protein n=1 Tax=Dreissena polymorpha TaxID=45954 RepID=A0A9D4EWS4_DREPO|nr:hypothetical protein DPMN_166256 [Dreissena polymorpha]
MFVDAGQTVVWRCKAVARPRASYSWYKDGVFLTNVPGKCGRRDGVLLTNVPGKCGRRDATDKCAR